MAQPRGRGRKRGVQKHRPRLAKCPRRGEPGTPQERKASQYMGVQSTAPLVSLPQFRPRSVTGKGVPSGGRADTRRGRQAAHVPSDGELPQERPEASCGCSLGRRGSSRDTPSPGPDSGPPPPLPAPRSRVPRRTVGSPDRVPHSGSPSKVAAISEFLCCLSHSDLKMTFPVLSLVRGGVWFPFLPRTGPAFCLGPGTTAQSPRGSEGAHRGPGPQHIPGLRSVMPQTEGHVHHQER